MVDADEIRMGALSAMNEINNAFGGYPAQQAVAVAHIAGFASEIAAQLAELNESRKPRWVEFKMENDPVMIDASGVRSVWSFGEKNMCRICFSHDSTGGQIVQEGYESVCAKLGIEIAK